jgi:hypothetical protein
MVRFSRCHRALAMRLWYNTKWSMHMAQVVKRLHTEWLGPGRQLDDARTFFGQWLWPVFFGKALGSVAAVCTSGG